MVKNPMSKNEIDLMVEKYKDEMITDESWFDFSTQFDDRSASINYSFVRELQPTCIVEFGTRTGRCTTDILMALLKNGKIFKYLPFELDYGLRKASEAHVKIKTGYEIKIGGDIMEYSNIPDNIEYLFVDNFHDEKTTQWLFDVLIKKCVPGALVQIHDIPLMDDFKIGKVGGLEETDLIVRLYKEGRLPLEKVYWTFEEGNNMESSWWKYKPL